MPSPGVRRAASRKLEHELGIPTSATPPDAFTYLTRIHYLAPSDGLWGEHESASSLLTTKLPSREGFALTSHLSPVDYILFITSPTDHTGNPNEVSDTRYVSKAELQAMFEDSGPCLGRFALAPSRSRLTNFVTPANSFTPWFKLIARDFLFGWWDQLIERKTIDGEFKAESVADLADNKIHKM